MPAGFGVGKRVSKRDFRGFHDFFKIILNKPRILWDKHGSRSSICSIKDNPASFRVGGCQDKKKSQPYGISTIFGPMPLIVHPCHVAQKFRPRRLRFSEVVATSTMLRPRCCSLRARCCSLRARRLCRPLTAADNTKTT